MGNIGNVQQIVSNIIITLVPLILSLTVHEYAHAMTAGALGDDTATMMGRKTLNPASHIDPLGTLVLPIAMVIFSSGMLFGWAKPVPVNPLRFDRRVTMSTGMLITAAAGPLANLILAFTSAGIFAILHHSGVRLQTPQAILRFLTIMIQLNVVLAIFNMIPIYPLDGQKVLAGLLSADLRERFQVFSQRFGPMLLLLFFFTGSRYLAIPARALLDYIFAIFQLR